MLRKPVLALPPHRMRFNFHRVCISWISRFKFADTGHSDVETYASEIFADKSFLEVNLAIFTF